MKGYRKNPVGAHYGLGDWLLQRLTAVVMALYTLLAVACIVMAPPATHADWQALFARTPFRVVTMLFVLSLLYHAWVGMRDIIMDYVRSAGARLVLESAVVLVLLFYLVWAASLLWGR